MAERVQKKGVAANGAFPGISAELPPSAKLDTKAFEVDEDGDCEEDRNPEVNGGDEGNDDGLALSRYRDLEQGEDDEYDDYYDEDIDEENQGEIQTVPDEEKTPVTVVTGFLGSGKTTLVNYILREQREMKIAVIENEFGAVSIDTALVEENVRETEDIVTMDNGCVCCTVRGDLVKALLNFLDRRDTFDCILLETTGIADPSPIVATFNQEMDVKMNYRIDSVLCLVDAKNILTQLKRKAEGEGTVNEAVQQLAFADSVIINKTDLVDADQLKQVKEKVNSVNAFAKVVTAEKSRVPLKSVLNLRSYNLERTLELLDQEAKEEEALRKAKELEKEKEEAAKKEKAEANGQKKHKCGSGCTHDHDHKHSHGDDHKHSNGEKRSREEGKTGDGGDGPAAKKPKEETVRVSATRHDSQVGSLGLTLKGSFDVDKFNFFMRDFLDKRSADLFRQKGVLSFKDQAPKFVFQGVHETVDCEASPNEWAPDGSDRESKIVFIGLNLDKDYITKSLTDCLVSEKGN